jgi:integrase
MYNSDQPDTGQRLNLECGEVQIRKEAAIGIEPMEVALSAPLLQRLLNHKRTQAEARLKAGPNWQAHGLVFCSEIGTPLAIPSLTYRYFRPLLIKAELPQIRLYDLRHSCAMLLLIADSERLGHSTVMLTLDTYSHVLPTMQQQATAKLEKMLYNDLGISKAQKPRP